MKLEIDVLRALLRLARRRTPATLERIVVRVGQDEPNVRRALGALARSGLVQRDEGTVRLSMAGLATAVAIAHRPAQKKASGARTAQAPRKGAGNRRRAA